MKLEEHGVSDIENLHLGSVLSGGGDVPPNNTPEGWRSMLEEYQQRAMKSTRLGIPLLYGIDAVHGEHSREPIAGQAFQSLILQSCYTD